MKLGIEKTAMIRVRAGISFALTEAMDEGHCGLPTDELMSLAEKLLEVPIDLVRAALDLETSEGTVIADRVGETRCVFLAGLHGVDVTSIVHGIPMQGLIKPVHHTAALLIVGDIDQLPSVGPGQVLEDVISSRAMPVVRLTAVSRQAAHSRIITAALRINQGL